MGLTRYRLGDLIEHSTLNNRDERYGSDLIRGVNNKMGLTAPKGDIDNVNLKPYKIVREGAFVYNPSRLNLGSLAYCQEKLCIVSHLYTVFYLSDKGKSVLNPIYLYLYFMRDEFFREVTFRNFGSQRPEFNFKKMSDLEINLPPLKIQQKYVDIYNAMVANQKCYEESLEDLKLACDAGLEALMSEMEMDSIGGYIQLTDERNNGVYSSDNVRGISIEKVFIPTKAKMDGVSVKNYKIVEPRDIAYVPVTSRNGGKITIAQNVEGAAYLISSAYTSFRCNETKLLPEYLMLFFTRPEFDRYARFHSWGSAREVFSWDDMRDVRIPIPDIKTQQSLANLFTAYNQRKEINERMKTQIKDICPILIKGTLEEASKA
ncbi:MAG TPA: restriction endonuclease subunit S [Coriobacteriaceae bacterium]|nr:restriction endonuclease subunit S [Coriobacteriaceae bacterium]